MHTRMRLGELLLASGLLSADQLEAALQGQRSSGMKLGEYLIKQGICRESDVVDAVCRQTGIERYTPSRFPLNLSLSDRLPADVAQRTNAVPLLIRGDVLVVAMMDPLDIDALDRIEIVTDREVEPVMCLRQEFTQLYAALYGHFNTMDGVMESFTALPDQPMASDDLLIASETPKDELGQPDEAPVVRLVNSILTQAVRESASDIHISPEKDSIQIRFRIDGKLRKTPSPPKSVGASIVSRIKILANMDISITRVPQDGRFTMMVDRREINVRVSTLPTIYGENVVMRLLDMSTNHVYTLDKLGMSDKDCKTISQTIERPYGMILSTGPTGSGKSTTLAALVDYANTKRRDHIVTIEDPIEFVHQSKSCLVNQREIGRDSRSFGTALRSALREDPDIILVGEMRDLETISLALEAAETGHLVFATLHTISAPKTIDRIIEVFPPEEQAQIRTSLSESIQAIIAQTLFKRADKKGRVPALEIMFGIPSVRNMIRESKTFQLPSVLQTNRNVGMQTMDDDIERLLMQRIIAPEAALVHAQDKGRLREAIGKLK